MMKLLRTWWLPALLICLPLDRIPSFALHVGTHSATLHLSQLVAAAGIVLFGPQILKRVRFSFTSPYFWMAVYIVVMALSVAISIDKTRSLIAFVATILTISAGVIVAHVVTIQNIARFQKWLFGVTIAVSLFGIYQFIGDSFGLSHTLTGLRAIYTAKVFGFPRVQSTELEPLFFANYLLLPLLLTAALLIGGIKRSGLFYAQLFLFGLLLSLTLSRGGILGSIIALVLIALLLIRQTSLIPVGGVALTIALSGAVAVGSIYAATGIAHHSAHKGDRAVHRYVAQSTNLTSSATSADSDRVVDRKLAQKEFRAHPLLGGGIGSFGSYAKQVAPVAYPAKGNSPTVNNEYFEILAETGALGALAIAGLVITLLIRLFRTWRQSLIPEHRAWLVALVAVGVAYAIQYNAFSTLYIPHIWVTLGLIVALTAPLQLPASSHGKTRGRRA